MAILDCGIFKHPLCSTLPRFPKLKPNHFPTGQWVPVLTWEGYTIQTLVHRVTVTPANAVVKWRRSSTLQRGVKTGSFNGGIDFNIYPTDASMTIEVWVDDPKVRIKVELLTRPYP